MLMKRTFLLTWMVAIATLMQVQSEIKLPAIFADHMVIQRDASTKMWGKADANKRVTVVTSWNLKRYTTTSDANAN